MFEFKEGNRVQLVSEHTYNKELQGEKYLTVGTCGTVRKVYGYGDQLDVNWDEWNYNYGKPKGLDGTRHCLTDADCVAFEAVAPSEDELDGVYVSLGVKQTDVKTSAEYRIEHVGLDEGGDHFIFIHRPTGRVLLTTQSVSAETLIRLMEEDGCVQT